MFAHRVLGFLVQGEDNKGRCTNILDGCHPTETNWCPHLHHPHCLYWMPFLPQPSQFILAWDRRVATLHPATQLRDS